jgi:hypothetical protein
MYIKEERYLKRHQFEMELSIKNIVDYFENQLYKVEKLPLCCTGEFYYQITPPNFPQEGVETEQQQFEYLKKEFENVSNILTETFPTKQSTKTVNFYYTIKKPVVNSN